MKRLGIPFRQLGVPLGLSAVAAARSIFLTGLVAYWSFNNGLTTDDTGNGNTLSAVNNAARGIGSIHEGADFKTDDALTIAGGSAGNLNLGNVGFTICCRVRLDGNGAAQAILGKYNTTGNQRGYRLLYSPTPTDRFLIQISANGTAVTTLTMTNAGAPVVGRNHAIVIWYDPDANTLYAQMDGGTLDSVAHSGGAFINTSSFNIAQYADGTTKLSGMIDEIGVWKRIWSAGERANYFAGTTYPFTPLVSRSDTVISSVISGSVELAYPSRVPHQRQTFYAAGRYWVFFGFYNDNTSYELRFTSSADDAKTWRGVETLTTFPACDAAWNVIYDPTTGLVHVTKNTQTGAIFLDGMQYRRGTPNADGTISWDAGW